MSKKGKERTKSRSTDEPCKMLEREKNGAFVRMKSEEKKWWKKTLKINHKWEEKKP